MKADEKELDIIIELLKEFPRDVKEELEAKANKQVRLRSFTIKVF